MSKKLVQIDRGNFAGKDTKGNFTAYSSEEKVFIHKGLMTSNNWKEDKDVVYPFFAVIEEKEIPNALDASGEPIVTAEKRMRVQASGIFNTKSEMIASYNSSKLLQLEADNQIAEANLVSKLELAGKAKSAGLSQAGVDALLALA